MPGARHVEVVTGYVVVALKVAVALAGLFAVTAVSIWLAVGFVLGVPMIGWSR